MAEADDGGAVDVPSGRAAAASAGEHKALHRRWIDAYNDRDEVGEAEVRAPEYVAYAPGEPKPLRDEAWRAMIGSYVDGMPDLVITIEDLRRERLHGIEEHILRHAHGRVSRTAAQQQAHHVLGP